jgi:hypothetical protein
MLAFFVPSMKFLTSVFFRLLCVMHISDMKDTTKTTPSSNTCASVPKELLVKLINTNTSCSAEEVKENEAFTKKFMEDHVYNVYERIAEHFSHTRYTE